MPDVLEVMRQAIVLSLLPLFLLAGCLHVKEPGTTVTANPNPEDHYVNFVTLGMTRDSAETLAGEPAYVVRGIPTIIKELHEDHDAYGISTIENDRFEVWYYSPAKIDSITSSVEVTLYSDDFDDYPQHTHEAQLEYCYSVVIDRTSHRVVKCGYLPRGFIDCNGGLRLGAVIRVPYGESRLMRSTFHQSLRQFSHDLARHDGFAQ